MSEFNFKSQICTTREQSERLLSLGLKKETADIVHYFSQSLAQDWTIVPLADGETAKHIQGLEIPAWSLDRLIEILDIWHLDLNFHNFDNAYEQVISYFEERVKGGFINKKYLEE